jgi:hypothetical protein
MSNKPTIETLDIASFKIDISPSLKLQDMSDFPASIAEVFNVAIINAENKGNQYGAMILESLRDNYSNLIARLVSLFTSNAPGNTEELTGQLNKAKETVVEVSRNFGIPEEEINLFVGSIYSYYGISNHN